MKGLARARAIGTQGIDKVFSEEPVRPVKLRVSSNSKLVSDHSNIGAVAELKEIIQKFGGSLDLEEPERRAFLQFKDILDGFQPRVFDGPQPSVEPLHLLWELAYIFFQAGHVLSDLLDDENLYLRAFPVCRRIVNFHPNPGPERDVAIANEKNIYYVLLAAGDVLRASGHLQEAYEAYIISRDRAKRSAESIADTPENEECLYNLVIIHHKIGDMLLAEGDRAAALREYRQSLDICEALARRDPSNAEWQSDLAYVRDQISVIEREIGKSDGSNYTGEPPSSSPADDTPQKGMGDDFDIGNGIGARLLRELSPAQLARVLENTTLARLMARYENGLAELDVERERFTSKEQADAAANVAVTLRRLQGLQAELHLPITETPEQVQKGEAMATKFRRSHDETGDPIPPRPRGRPRRRASASTAATRR